VLNRSIRQVPMETLGRVLRFCAKYKKKKTKNPKCGRVSFLRFVGVRVGVASWVNKLTLRL